MQKGSQQVAHSLDSPRTRSATLQMTSFSGTQVTAGGVSLLHAPFNAGKQKRMHVHQVEREKTQPGSPMERGQWKEPGSLPNASSWRCFVLHLPLWNTTPLFAWSRRGAASPLSLWFPSLFSSRVPCLYQVHDKLKVNPASSRVALPNRSVPCSFPVPDPHPCIMRCPGPKPPTHSKSVHQPRTLTDSTEKGCLRFAVYKISFTELQNFHSSSLLETSASTPDTQQPLPHNHSLVS